MGNLLAPQATSRSLPPSVIDGARANPYGWMVCVIFWFVLNPSPCVRLTALRGRADLFSDVLVFTPSSYCIPRRISIFRQFLPLLLPPARSGSTAVTEFLAPKYPSFVSSFKVIPSFESETAASPGPTSQCMQTPFRCSSSRYAWLDSFHFWIALSAPFVFSPWFLPSSWFLFVSRGNLSFKFTLSESLFRHQNLNRFRVVPLAVADNFTCFSIPSLFSPPRLFQVLTFPSPFINANSYLNSGTLLLRVFSLPWCSSSCFYLLLASEEIFFFSIFLLWFFFDFRNQRMHPLKDSDLNLAPGHPSDCSSLFCRPPRVPSPCLLRAVFRSRPLLSVSFSSKIISNPFPLLGVPYRLFSLSST